MQIQSSVEKWAWVFVEISTAKVGFFGAKKLQKCNFFHDPKDLLNSYYRFQIIWDALSLFDFPKESHSLSYWMSLQQKHESVRWRLAEEGRSFLELDGIWMKWTKLYRLVPEMCLGEIREYSREKWWLGYSIFGASVKQRSNQPREMRWKRSHSAFIAPINIDDRNPRLQIDRK
jgi:hypothetical protein